MRTVCWLVAGLVGVGLITGILVAPWLMEGSPSDKPQPKETSPSRGESATMAIQTERCKVDWIPPGTVLEDKQTVPEGWTALLYTSAPVLSEEDLKGCRIRHRSISSCSAMPCWPRPRRKAMPSS